jgi:dipicolinate synthase subunit A
MPVNWPRLTIAVLGGDEREQEIARLAADTGARVKVYGFPWPPAGIEGVRLEATAQAAMVGADYALLPIPRGVGGFLYTTAGDPVPIEQDLFTAMRPGAHVFCGRVTEHLASASRGIAVTLHEYDPDQELMLERSAAIAEGAVAAAIANTRVTIHGAMVAVVGFGNIGSAIARRLYVLGAKVTVAARNPVQRAAARADGARAIELHELPGLAPRLSMIFSTVPARVVDQRVLERLPARSLVLEIVPPPERSDLESARLLGHKAVWARGLGRRAPITVGSSQWRGIRRRIESLNASEQKKPSEHE